MIIMKQETSITAARRERKIGILTCLATILCIGISFGYIRYARGYRQFRIPEHEAAARGEGKAAMVKICYFCHDIIRF